MADQRPTAFDTRIAPQLPLLFRAAWRLTGNRADAEDLVQDTCVLACENFKALGEADHPDRWLLWLGVLFILCVYYFPTGIVGRLRR